MLKDCCAIAVAETMNNTIPLSSLFFMLVPLTMTEFTVFSTPARRLARWLITGDLPALGPSLLLGLPVGGATVVTAQRIGAWLTGPLLKITLLQIVLLRRLRDPFLLSLCDCLTILSLLCACPLRGLRLGIVTAVVVTL